MANLMVVNKDRIFRQLNERKLPWGTSRFVIKEDAGDFLGCGGFSEVYVMEDTKDSSVKYAVKIFGFDKRERLDQSKIQSYLDEAAIQFGLVEQCSTVVKIIDTEVLSIKLDEKGNVEDARLDDSGIGQPGWLVLAMIKMEKLSPVIEEPDYNVPPSLKIPALKNADEKEILTLAIDVAEALDTSHSLKIMHRDVKLENIFYDSNNRIYKLGDFGIAKITNQGNAFTKGIGTLGYEAPEVEGGNDAQYSFQADIYSFGVTVYLLMNDLKFPGSTEIYRKEREVQYNPNARIELPMHGSDELKQFISSLIRFYPSDRPQNMAEVLAGLNDIYKKKYGERESHKSAVGNSAAEAKEEPAAAVVKPDVLDAKRIEMPKADTTQAMPNEMNPKNGLEKGILGVLFLCVGLLYFGLLSGESLTLIKTPMVMISLAANSLASVAAYFLKFAKREKISYLVYFLLFVFSIVVMFTGGMSWLYLILAIGLFIGGVTEVFSIHLAAWIYVLLTSLQTGSALDSVISINYAWIFFALALFGLILTEQYDRQEDFFGIILGAEASHYLIGLIVLIIGVVLFLLNLIPAITVAPLLMKMHFIYVGLIMWVAGGIAGIIDRRTRRIDDMY